MKEVIGKRFYLILHIRFVPKYSDALSYRFTSDIQQRVPRRQVYNKTISGGEQKTKDMRTEPGPLIFSFHFSG
jgi:hypothetical protein